MERCCIALTPMSDAALKKPRCFPTCSSIFCCQFDACSALIEDSFLQGQTPSSAVNGWWQPSKQNPCVVALSMMLYFSLKSFLLPSIVTETFR